jgi:hypothetical protein
VHPTVSDANQRVTLYRLTEHPRQAKPDPRREAPKAGDLVVEILRGGVDVRGPCSVGDRIAMPEQEARKLVESGAADFVRVGKPEGPFTVVGTAA